MGLGPGHKKWGACYDCGKLFHSQVQVALGWAAWKTYLGRPETNQQRTHAISMLGIALLEKYPEVSMSVLEYELKTLRRFWPRQIHKILTAQGNVATCLSRLKRHDEALSIQRAVYNGRKKLGAADERTLAAGVNLAGTLVNTGHFTEAKKFSRQLLSIIRQALGDRHDLTIQITSTLSDALFKSPSTTRADILEAEALLMDGVEMSRRVFGPQHPEVLRKERNLAVVRRNLAQLG